MLGTKSNQANSNRVRNDLVQLIRWNRSRAITRLVDRRLNSQNVYSSDDEGRHAQNCLLNDYEDAVFFSETVWVGENATGTILFCSANVSSAIGAVFAFFAYAR
jgi:hypothetical protein